MEFQNILIGTAILWALNNIIVMPVTNLLLSRKLAAAGLRGQKLTDLPVEHLQQWKDAAVRYFITVDVVVLAIAGLVGGLMGFWFIGFSTNAKSWPGMIAFIICSLLGVSIVGTR